MDISLFVFLEASKQNMFLWGGVVSPTPNRQPVGPNYTPIVWVLTLDLCAMTGPTSIYANVSVILTMIFDQSNPTTTSK